MRRCLSLRQVDPSPVRIRCQHHPVNFPLA
jgi:hypothetical protein